MTLTMYMPHAHSAIGSLVYSYIKYAEQQEKLREKPRADSTSKIKDLESGLLKQDNDNPPIPPHLK